MKGEKRSWTIRKGEAKAGCPRAGLQLEAGGVDAPFSCHARRGHLRCHIPMMGTYSQGPGMPGFTKDCQAHPTRHGTHPSKATGHGEKSQRVFWTREDASCWGRVRGA